MEGVAHVNVIYCRDYPKCSLANDHMSISETSPFTSSSSQSRSGDGQRIVPSTPVWRVRQNEIIDPSSRRIAFLGADQAIRQDVLMVMPYKLEASLVTRSRSGDGRMEFVVIECKNVWNNSLASFEWKWCVRDSAFVVLFVPCSDNNRKFFVHFVFPTSQYR